LVVRHHGQSPQGSLITAIGTLTGGLLAGVLTYAALIRTPARLKRVEMQLSYVERQLSELWGPLYGLLRTTQAEYRELLRRLDSTSSNLAWIDPSEAERDPFDDRDDPRKWAVWEEFLSRFFLPNNERIRDLIVGRYDLIGADSFPDIEIFLEHEAELKIKLLLRSESTTQAARPGLTTRFPGLLEYHVEWKLEFLRALQKLHRQQLDSNENSERIVFLAKKVAIFRALYRNPKPPGMHPDKTMLRSLESFEDFRFPWLDDTVNRAESGTGRPL
jgi:hypothetical protein